MKASWVTVEQLAAALQMSVVTIRRAYRNGEIPVERIRRMVRFDLHQVKQAMQRNGQDRVPGVRTKTDQRRATGLIRRLASGGAQEAPACVHHLEEIGLQ